MVRSGVVVDEDSGIAMPLRPGLSFSSAINFAHDSSSGWSTLESPALSYRINRVFSADVSVPYYLYVNAVRTTKTGATRLVGQTNELGDTAMAAHAEVHPWDFDYTGTVSVGFPTGNQQIGLSAGRITYNLNNHLEHDLGIFTPDIEVGIGNTSALVRPKVRKNYVSSGELMFFQAGTSVDLPADLSLDVEGYEQLPVGEQTVFSRVVRKSGTVLTQASSAEDNGISAGLDATVLKHLVLGATYNRSLRLNDTTEGLSVSFHFHVLGDRER